MIFYVANEHRHGAAHQSEVTDVSNDVMWSLKYLFIMPKGAKLSTLFIFVTWVAVTMLSYILCN